MSLGFSDGIGYIEHTKHHLWHMHVTFLKNFLMLHLSLFSTPNKYCCQLSEMHFRHVTSKHLFYKLTPSMSTCTFEFLRTHTLLSLTVLVWTKISPTSLSFSQGNIRKQTPRLLGKIKCKRWVFARMQRGILSEKLADDYLLLSLTFEQFIIASQGKNVVFFRMKDTSCYCVPELLGMFK